jgi:hypothetical protein
MGHLKYFLAALGGAALAAVFMGLMISDMSRPRVSPATALGTEQPIAMIVVRACGKAQGLLAVTPDGVVHNLPGPFTDEQKKAILGVAQNIKDKEHSLVSIDMPCSTGQPGGQDTQL